MATMVKCFRGSPGGIAPANTAEHPVLQEVAQ